MFLCICGVLVNDCLLSAKANDVVIALIEGEVSQCPEHCQVGLFVRASFVLWDVCMYLHLIRCVPCLEIDSWAAAVSLGHDS